MRLAFVYAGQGSQLVGMGKDLYNEFPTFKKTFDLLPDNLKSIAFNGPIEDLSKTQNTQPIMVAFAIGITNILSENNIHPSMTAGLSLGEYSALACGGAFTDSQAINLVTFRGHEMSKASENTKSKMMAVLALDKFTLSECCKKASEFGIVSIANYNCPGQLVIGGETAAVEKAAEFALENGAKRCIPLSVSGPFHTSLMKPAADALKDKFVSENIKELHIPVIFNTTAKPLQYGETVKKLLELQVQSSVYFQDTIEYMSQNGIDTIIEIGPGKVLSGFIRKIDPKIKTYYIEDIKTLNETLSAINC